MPSFTLAVLIFLVAVVYASVGHGGASGYLAMMALLASAPAPMATSALLLNVLVAGTSGWMFWRAGHGSLALLWPFLVGSVPAAFLGGWLSIASRTYDGLLAIALVAAAVRLCLPAPSSLRRQAGLPAPSSLRRQAGLPVTSSPPRRLIAGLAGAGIGLLSGLVGVGGGIFLSPLMILLGWAEPKPTAAASAGFIVVNSAAGLAGRLAAGRFVIGAMLPLVVAACAGGLVGARLGANHFSGRWLRRLLAAVLVVAAGKLTVPHG